MKYFPKLALTVGSTLFFVGVADGADIEVQTYKCDAGGCEIYCKKGASDWTPMARDAHSIVVKNMPNGNVEYFLDRGAKGDQSILISPENLQCRITGLY